MTGSSALAVVSLTWQALDLPLAIATGSVGAVRVRVPWRNLGHEAMTVTVEGVHLVLVPKEEEAGVGGVTEQAAATLAKREALAAWEAVQEQRKDDVFSSFVGEQVDKLVRSMLQKLEVTVCDVQVRIQRGVGASALAAGITLRAVRVRDLPALLAEPTAVENAMSAKEREARDAALVRKAVDIESLAVYLTSGAGYDTGHAPTASAEGDGTVPAEGGASAAMLDEADASCDSEAAAGGPVPFVLGRSLDLSAAISAASSMPPPPQSADTLDLTHSSGADGADGSPPSPSDFVLAPLHASMEIEFDPSSRAEAAGAPEATAASAWLRPWPKLRLYGRPAEVGAGVELALRHAQLGALLDMVETISRKERRHRFRACARPPAPPSRSAGNTHLWWGYAARAVISLSREDVTAVNWYELTKRRRQRREYLQVYAACRDEGCRLTEPREAEGGEHQWAVLQRLEAQMSLELVMRYRALSRAVSAQLGRRWWKTPPPAELGVAADSCSPAHRREQQRPAPSSGPSSKPTSKSEAPSSSSTITTTTTATTAPHHGKEVAAGPKPPPKPPSGGFDWFGLFKGAEQRQQEAAAAPQAAAATVSEDGAEAAGGGSHGAASEGGSTAGALMADDTETSLRRQVRARWSIGGTMSEVWLQTLQERLQDEGDPSAISELVRGASHVEEPGGGGAAGGGKASQSGAVLSVIGVAVPSLSVTLYTYPTQVMARLELSRVQLSLEQRAVLSGVELRVGVGAVSLTDLTTACPHLVDVIRGPCVPTVPSAVASSKAQAQASREDASGDDGADPNWLSFLLVTEPPESPAAAMLEMRVRPLSLIVNPCFLAHLMAYFQVPPSQWAAAIALETVTRGLLTNIVSALREAAAHLWRQRPVHLAVTVDSPSVLWVEPAPNLLQPAYQADAHRHMAATRPGASQHLAAAPVSTPASSSLDVHALRVSAAQLRVESKDALETEQAFALSLSSLSVELLPPGGLSGSRSASSASVLTIVHPLSVQLHCAVLLQTSAIEVPWVNAALTVDALAVSISEQQLTSLARLVAGTTHVLDEDALPSMPTVLSASADGAQLGADGHVAQEAGGAGRAPSPQMVAGRCGWFDVVERRTFQERTEETALGICWACVELGHLKYETQPEAGATATRRSLRLAEWELRGGAIAESFETYSATVALGVRYCVSVTLTASSRSLATRFLSACAAMQLHTRAEAPLVIAPSKAQTLVPGAKERQLRLRLRAEMESVSFVLLGARPSSEGPSCAQTPTAAGAGLEGGATATSSPHSFSMRLSQLSAGADYRKRDLQASVRLQYADSRVAVPMAAMAAADGAGKGSLRDGHAGVNPLVHLVAIGAAAFEDAASRPLAARSSPGAMDAGSTPRAPATPPRPSNAAPPAIDVRAAVASEGSPLYARAEAQLTVDVMLGDMLLHVSGQALEALGALTLRCHYQISKEVAATISRLRPLVGRPSAAQERAGATIPASDGAFAAPSTPLASRPIEAVGAPSMAPAAEEASEDPRRHLVKLTVRCAELAVCIHETPPSALVGAAAAVKSGLAVARLVKLTSTLALGLDSMHLGAGVADLALVAHGGLGVPPVEMLSMLSMIEPGAAAPTARRNDLDEAQSVADGGGAEPGPALVHAAPSSGARLTRQCSVASVGSIDEVISVEIEIDDAALQAEEDAAVMADGPADGTGVPGASSAALPCAAARTSLLSFELQTWEEGCKAHPGHDSELRLEIMPVRALLPAAVLRRIQDCFGEIHACFQGTLDMLMEQLSAAASAAVSGAAQAAAQTNTSGAKLSVLLHGPLLVLPSAHENGAALLVRMGDLALTNSSTGAEDAASRGAAPSERLQLALTNASVLVAPSLSALDEELRPRTGHRAHWFLRDLQLRLTIERTLHLPVPSTIGDVDMLAPMPSAEMRVVAELSALRVSVASSELMLLAMLAHEIVEAFADDASARPSPASSLTSVSEEATVQAAIAPPAQDAAAVESSGGKVVVNGSIDFTDGLHLELIDDMVHSVGVLPLFELAVDELEGSWMLVCLQQGGGGLGELEDANVQLQLAAHASFFNPTNDHWEPALERWPLNASLTLSRAPDVHGDGDEDDGELAPRDEAGAEHGGGRHAEADGAGPPGATSPRYQTVPEFTLMLASLEPLEANLSPPLITTVQSALMLCDKVSAVSRAGHTANSASAWRSISSTRMLGLRNLTEQPCTFDTGDGQVHRVGAGGEVSFADANGIPLESSIARSTTLAETTDNLELVRAARQGEVMLVAELLSRFANPNSYDPAKRRTALHAAAKHRHAEIVRMLLQAAADVELVMGDGSGTRALHLAAASGCMPAVEALIEARADAAAANAEGQNAAGVGGAHHDVAKLLYRQLQRSARSSGRRFPSAELVFASSRGDLARATALLRARASPNSTDGTLTALQRAVAERQFDVATVLLEDGADVRQTSPSGLTALHCAARAGPKRLVARILEAKADPLHGHALEGSLAVEACSAFRTQEFTATHELLCASTLMAAPIVGFLVKLGAERKSWKSRFCVLTSIDPSQGAQPQLRYYADESLTHLHGAIDLRDVLPEHLTAPSACPDLLDSPTLSAHGPNSFDLRVADRTYVFYAPNSSDAGRWIDMIRLLCVRAYARRVSADETPQQLSSESCRESSSVPSTSPPPRSARASFASQAVSMAAASSASAVAAAAPRPSFTRTGGNAFSRALFSRSKRTTSVVSDGVSDSSALAWDVATDRDEREDGAVGGTVTTEGTSLSVTVGVAGQPDCFEPLRALSLRPLGTRLHTLTPTAATVTPPSAGSAGEGVPSNSRHIGIISEVAYRAGLRTLTLRSAIQLVNDCKLAVEISPQHPQHPPQAGESASTAGVATAIVSAGATWPLPLCLTERGSEASVWEVKIRPALDGRAVIAATLLPPTLFSKDVAAGSNDALLICPSAEPLGRPWACCVAIEYETSSSATVLASGGAARHTTGGQGAAAAGKGPLGGAGRFGAVSRQRHFELLRRFKLPATETVLASWGCSVPAANGMERGELVLTRHFVCWLAKQSPDHDGVLLWSRVDVIQTSTVVSASHESIDLVRVDGRKLSFRGFERRDETLRALREVHSRARIDLATGDARWLPHILRLVPPLVVTNLLPCTACVALAPVEMTQMQASMVGWPALPAMMNPPSPHGSTGDERPVTQFTLASGESDDSHDVAMLGPIEVEVAVCMQQAGGGPSANSEDGRTASADVRRGKLFLERPSDRVVSSERLFTLHAPVGASASHPLHLLCALRGGPAGSLQLTLMTAHWLENRSSLPVRLFDAALTSDVAPIAEADAHAAEGVPFSLSSENSRGASCRIGVAPTTAARSSARLNPAEAALEHGKSIRDGRLSRRFAANTSGSGACRARVARAAPTWLACHPHPRTSALATLSCIRCIHCMHCMRCMLELPKRPREYRACFSLSASLGLASLAAR